MGAFLGVVCVFQEQRKVYLESRSVEEVSQLGSKSSGNELQGQRSLGKRGKKNAPGAGGAEGTGVLLRESPKSPVFSCEL